MIERRHCSFGGHDDGGGEDLLSRLDAKRKQLEGERRKAARRAAEQARTPGNQPSPVRRTDQPVNPAAPASPNTDTSASEAPPSQEPPLAGEEDFTGRKR